jgi:hypothetical protein
MSGSVITNGDENGGAASVENLSHATWPMQSQDEDIVDAVIVELDKPDEPDESMSFHTA